MRPPELLFLGLGVAKLFRDQVLCKCGTQRNECCDSLVYIESVLALGCEMVKERALGAWSTWPHLQKAT